MLWLNQRLYFRAEVSTIFEILQQLTKIKVVVAWIFTRQGHINQVSTRGWGEWLRSKARQWSDLGPIKIFKIEFDIFHVILLITCIKITYTISSQLAGDTFDKNYIWCDLFNFVQSYFFCLPWFIFLGDSLCFLDSWYVIQCAQRRDVIEIIIHIKGWSLYLYYITQYTKKY